MTGGIVHRVWDGEAKCWRARAPRPRGSGGLRGTVARRHRQPDPDETERKAKAFGLELPDDLLARVALPVVRRVLTRFGKGVVEKLRLEVAFDVHDPRVLRFLRDWGGDRIKELVGSTTRAELGEAIARVAREGGRFEEAVAAVRAVFRRASETRAETIALTETTRAATFGTLEGMRQGGVERSRWLSTPDSYTRDTHQAMNGQVRDAGEPFLSPSGAKALGPGMFEQAAETVNCRCFLQPLPDGGDPDDKSAHLRLLWKAEADQADPLAAEMETALRVGFKAQEQAMVVALHRRMKAAMDPCIKSWLGPT